MMMMTWNPKKWLSPETSLSLFLFNFVLFLKERKEMCRLRRSEVESRTFSKASNTARGLY